MKKLLSFFFFLIFAVAAPAIAGVKTFPLNTPIKEGLLLACKEEQAAVVIAKLSSENRTEEVDFLVPQLVARGICAIGYGTVTYVRQVLRVLTSYGLFTVYEAKVEGISFPLYIPMKDWEHASA
jgi:hypothetical protein